INGSLKQNFYEYINSWRIAHAKRLMASDDDQLTILEILYQSGFNSKSSFNAFFKKSEGLTPTQYRKKIQQMGSDS
ncbi:MAG: helix-turn-helix domain-containing protein, partial [Fulvivirga sp.]|nr:helix-turn-helix domain-containing protein [Fulvivirga sp.]